MYSPTAAYTVLASLGSGAMLSTPIRFESERPAQSRSAAQCPSAPPFGPSSQRYAPPTSVRAYGVPVGPNTTPDTKPPPSTTTFFQAYEPVAGVSSGFSRGSHVLTGGSMSFVGVGVGVGCV